MNGAKEEVKEVPLHKKNPDVGNKTTIYSKNLIMEKEDADSFEDKEEVRYLTLFYNKNIPLRILDYAHGLGKCNPKIQI